MYHLPAIGEHDATYEMRRTTSCRRKSPSTRPSHRPNMRSSSPNRIPNPITSLALCLALRSARPQQQVRIVRRQLISGQASDCVLINQPHLPAVVLLLQRSEQPPVVAEALAAQPVAVDEVHEENTARQHRSTFSLSSVST